jgi:hypothetical protein
MDRSAEDQHFGPPQAAPVQAGASIATHLPEPSQNYRTPALETQDAPAVQADALAAFFFAASDGAADMAMATMATALTSKNCENDFI